MLVDIDPLAAGITITKCVCPLGNVVFMALFVGIKIVLWIISKHDIISGHVISDHKTWSSPESVISRYSAELMIIGPFLMDSMIGWVWFQFSKFDCLALPFPQLLVCAEFGPVCCLRPLTMHFTSTTRSIKCTVQLILALNLWPLARHLPQIQISPGALCSWLCHLVWTWFWPYINYHVFQMKWHQD
jgi:hypothetical protein